MAEEALFEFLHHEIVALVVENEKKSMPEGGQNAVSKLERIGFATGYRIVERLTREWPRFKDELDTMKFICKDFWLAVHRKQIDNLRTNHQGVYVLLDNRFRFLSHMSSGKQYLESSPQYLAYMCGMMRGALSNLGLNCVVTAEVTHMPACKFHIQVQRT